MRTSLFAMLLAVLCAGCVTRQPGDIVRPHYQARIRPRPESEKTPQTVRINEFEFEPPDTHVPIGGVLTKLVPLVCLLPIRDEIRTNWAAVDLGPSAVHDRRAGDIEGVFVDELTRSGLFERVTFKGPAADYEIRGRVDLRRDGYSHMSGLGIFWIGILPMIVLPAGNVYYICDARLEVVASTDGKVVLSKTYSAKHGITYWVIAPGRLIGAHGREVVPAVVEQFVEDLETALKGSP